MGNICSRSANQPDDPFSRPGRPLNSAPSEQGRQNKARASVPAQHKTPGRTLGGGGGGGEEGSGPGTDARTKAALAAQVCLVLRSMDL